MSSLASARNTGVLSSGSGSCAASSADSDVRTYAVVMVPTWSASTNRVPAGVSTTMPSNTLTSSTTSTATTVPNCWPSLDWTGVPGSRAVYAIGDDSSLMSPA